MLYDERMLEHQPINWVKPSVFPRDIDECEEDYPVENPERLRVLYERLCQVQDNLIYDRKDDELYIPSYTIFLPLECQMASKQQIMLAHSEAQYERLEELQYFSDTELLAMSEKHRHDVYYCRETFKAARLAAGGLLGCVDAACSPSSVTNKAVALIRPPGHHACQEKEMGFCFVDSVVIAAKYAVKHNLAKRVLILDWDIHDGNGTAEATINDPNIFRIDIHRAQFYPYTGSMAEVGNGNARGLNLNLAWSQEGMGNSEYAAAFYELVLPLMAEYDPDLVLISCGLDAAKGDLLGGCEVTPDFYHAMTRSTLEVLGPDVPVICALEGGYTMDVIPDCMEAVTLALMNCPYKYHSSLQIGSYVGGAAQETRRDRWPISKLERSRKVLSKYYVRGCCYRLIPAAINDINTCMRIFKDLPRWSKVPLRRLKSPLQSMKTKKGGTKRKTDKLEDATQANTWEQVPFQRPRIYLWYGTEHHHVKVW